MSQATNTEMKTTENNQIGFFDKAWALTKASARPAISVACVGVAAYAGYRAGRQSMVSTETPASV